MGIEEKMDELTKEIVALRQTIEQNGLGGGSTNEAKKAPAKKAPAKKAPAKKAAKPEHSSDDVASIMREAAKEVDADAIRAYIKEQGCNDLADLLTKPELYDGAYAFAKDMLDSNREEEEEDDEDDI